MDRINNPFCPGAGSPPPSLSGREKVLEQAQVLLGRVIQKRAEKSVLLTGLRGVGKTVLLNHIHQLAEEQGYKSMLVEAHADKSLVELLAPHIRSLLFSLERSSSPGNKARKALRVFKSFVSAVRLKVGPIELGLDLEPEPGLADSGDLEVDLPMLFVAIAEAAEERGFGVALLIDEIQYLDKHELSALIMAMHKMQQRVLPLVLVGAGLSILPGLLGESKTYAERLFQFIPIGALSEEDSNDALQKPVQANQVTFSGDALKQMYALTEGYPYFIQEWGYQAWNMATQSPIGIDVIKQATEKVVERLDQNFFRVRFERLSEREKHYLLAMATQKERPCRSGDVAEALNVPSNIAAPLRADLIKKGMIYSPERGLVDFTVPLFDVFMRRAMADV